MRSASDVGLDMPRFRKAMEGSEFEDAVNADIEAGERSASEELQRS